MSLRGQRRDANRLVRLRRGHGRCQRIACAARVVLRHPQREIDHRSRQERLVVEHFEDVFDLVGRRLTGVQRGGRIDDDAGDDALAERHDDARAARRRRDAIRHLICEDVEKWDGNRDRDQPHRIRPRLRR